MSSTTSFTVLYTKNDQKKRKSFSDGVCKAEKTVSSKTEYVVSLYDSVDDKLTFLSKKVLSAPLECGSEFILNNFLVQVEAKLPDGQLLLPPSVRQTPSFPLKPEHKKSRGTEALDDEVSSSSTSVPSLLGKKAGGFEAHALVSSKFATSSSGLPLKSSSSSIGGGGGGISKYPVNLPSSKPAAANTPPNLDILLKNKMHPHQIEAAEWIISKFEDNEKIEIFPELESDKSDHNSMSEESDDDFISDANTFSSKSSVALGSKTTNKFECRGVILADEMGLGKTLTAISVIWSYVKLGRSKAIIVCPSSLIGNWEKEISKWMNLKLKPIILRPGPEAAQSLQTFNLGHISMSRLLIISYEMYRNLGVEINAMNNVDLIILDEGHRMKNISGTQTSSLIRQSPATKRLLLTGTPIQNDLKELFSLISFVQPQILDEMSAIQSKLIKPIERGFDLKATKREKSEADKASKLLNLFLAKILMRRTEAAILRKILPPRTDYIVHCAMSCEQLKEYCSASNLILNSLRIPMSIISDAISSTSSSGSLISHAIPAIIRKNDDGSNDDDDNDTFSEAISEAGMVLNQLQKLRLICTVVEPKVSESSKSSTSSKSHSISSLSQLLSKWIIVEDMLLALHANSSSTSSSKLSSSSASSNSSNSSSKVEKIVIVSLFTLALDVMESLCKKRNFQYCRLDGSVPSSKRFDIVEDFNRAGSPKTVFLLSSKAGGVGINLVAASRLIMLDCDWNPATDLQAMARIWRQGQTKECFVYRLITKFSIEDAILMRQRSKHVLQGVFTADDKGVGGSGGDDGDDEFNAKNKKKPMKKEKDASFAETDHMDVYDHNNDSSRNVNNSNSNSSSNSNNDEMNLSEDISSFNQRLSLTKREIIDLIRPQSYDSRLKKSSGSKSSSNSNINSNSNSNTGDENGESISSLTDLLMHSCFLGLQRKGLVIDVVEVDSAGTNGEERNNEK